MREDKLTQMEDQSNDENAERLLTAAAETATDFDQISRLLEAVNLYDDFTDFVEDEIVERGEE